MIYSIAIFNGNTKDIASCTLNRIVNLFASTPDIAKAYAKKHNGVVTGWRVKP